MALDPMERNERFTKRHADAPDGSVHRIENNSPRRLTVAVAAAVGVNPIIEHTGGDDRRRRHPLASSPRFRWQPREETVRQDPYRTSKPPRIVRQMRLRGSGGMIIVTLLDMVPEPTFATWCCAG